MDISSLQLHLPSIPPHRAALPYLTARLVALERLDHGVLLEDADDVAVLVADAGRGDVAQQAERDADSVSGVRDPDHQLLGVDGWRTCGRRYVSAD